MRKIILSIGLNDKITKVQEVNTLDAYKIVGNIIGRDCSITEGRGVYTHKDGTVVFETSLFVNILDFENSIDDEWIEDKVEQVKIALNQESVAVEKTEVNSVLL